MPAQWKWERLEGWGQGCGASGPWEGLELGEWEPSAGFSAQKLCNQTWNLEEPFRGWLGGRQSAVGRPGGVSVFATLRLPQAFPWLLGEQQDFPET